MHNLIFYVLVLLAISAIVWSIVYMRSSSARTRSRRDKALARVIWIVDNNFRDGERDEQAFEHLTVISKLVKAYGLKHEEINFADYRAVCVAACRSFNRFVSWYRNQVKDSWTIDLTPNEGQLTVPVNTYTETVDSGSYARAKRRLVELERRRKDFFAISMELFDKTVVSNRSKPSFPDVNSEEWRKMLEQSRKNLLAIKAASTWSRQ